MSNWPQVTQLWEQDPIAAVACLPALESCLCDSTVLCFVRPVLRQ